MTEILLATRNPKKVTEIRALMAGMPIHIKSLLDFPDIPETPEAGDSFEANARVKAEAALKATGMISIADDSGLEVDALGGEPGVFSNRFAGPGASDRDKYMKLLRMMEEVPDDKRAARFHAAIAIAAPGKDTVVVEGICEGQIARAPHGEHGFGYDPVFYLPELGRMMADLPPERKNAISHRGKALQKAKKIVEKLTG